MFALFRKYLAIGLFLLLAQPILAEGFVPPISAFVYTTGRCGLSPNSNGGKGSTPGEAYARACLPSEEGYRNWADCQGTMKQLFGPLGAQTSPWQWEGTYKASFQYAYSRAFAFNNSGTQNCTQYDYTANLSGGITIERAESQSCPAYSHFAPDNQCECDPGYLSNGQVCLPQLVKLRDKPQSCQPQLGNPIFPLTGSKKSQLDLGRWFGDSAAIVYDSRGLPLTLGGQLPFLQEPAPSFGRLWQSNFHKRLNIRILGDNGVVQAYRGAGVVVSFQKNGGEYVADADISDRLQYMPGNGWRYWDLRSGAIEVYDSGGTLMSVAKLDGNVLTYTYSDANTPVDEATRSGLLIRVADGFGRQLKFSYQATGSVYRFTDPNGKNTKFGYDLENRLIRVTWPDGKIKEFLYENSIPWALTGVLDENQVRTSTYGYDLLGRALDTMQAGGVNHFHVAYETPPGWLAADSIGAGSEFYWREYSWQAPDGITVTGPNGHTSKLTATNVQGTPHLAAQDQPAGSGCSASTSSTGFDSNGNKSWAEDFNGYRTCYANDLSRNLETGRVEGLLAGSACEAVLADGGALPMSSRKVTTAWHPTWRLPIKVAEPGRTTIWVYNGQPDPTNGGATASCAPSSAVLPDGSPIVVLCKQVEQATTDANGSQGFGASADSGVVARVQLWTYTQYGQVLTYRDPLGNLATNTYFSSTTADYTTGDLATMTNALNQVTTFTKYDLAGQWLQRQDANGILTTRVFDERQRLTNVSLPGSATNYDYWPTGLLKKITLPDMSSISYEYDDAHRLTAIADNMGNRLEYILDATGNRIGEQFKDPSGSLARSLARNFDALNRVQQSSGAVK